MSSNQPSQAGRFKPRKQKTKAKISSINTPATAATSRSNEFHRGGRDTAGRAGRGRGRGGRGGRGRIPIPSGKAFFTGDAMSSTPAEQAQRSAEQKQESKAPSSNSFQVFMPNSGMSFSSRNSRNNEGEETIIGEIEGYDEANEEARKKAAEGDSGVYENSLFDNENQQGGAANIVATYESDDDDESMEDVEPLNMETEKKEDSYERYLKRQADDPFILPFPHPPKTTSLSSNRSQARSQWLLFKFPTRIPLRDATQPLQDENASPDDLVSSSASGIQQPTSQTITSSSNAVGFDDTLKEVPSGFYGKLRRYKSGRMELVMESNNYEENNEPFTMQVHDGLQSGFLQQLVSIDAEKGKLIPLGYITKSFVVSPDTDRAFD